TANNEKAIEEAQEEITTMFRKYETIDFEEPDHPVLRLHYAGQSKMSLLIQDLMHYLLSFVLVVVIVVLFLGLSYGTEFFAEQRLQQIKEYVSRDEKGVATLFSIVTALAAILVPAVLVVFVAPTTIGSGMTEVIAFLNGASALHGVTMKTLAVKYVSIIGMVSAGLFSGIDGPMAEIGAGVGIVLAKQVTQWVWFRKLFYGETLDLGKIDDLGDQGTHLNDTMNGINRITRWTHKKLVDGLLSFLQHRTVRLYATMGSSVAIAVIFKAPIGGVLFAVEEATSFFELKLLIQLTFATMCGYLIVAYTTSGVEHQLLGSVYLNPQETSLFPLQSSCEVRMSIPDVLAYIAIGILAALLGQLLNKILSIVQRFRLKNIINPATDKEGHPKNHNFKNMIRIVEVLVVAVLTAVVVIWVPSNDTLDHCISLKTPLSHITSTTPECSFAGSDHALSCESLLSCKEALQADGVCYPKSTELQFNNLIVETYQTYCASSEPDLQSPTNGTHAVKRTDASLTASNLTLSNFEFHFDPSSLKLGELLVEGEECYYQVRTLLWTSPERQLKLLLLRGVYNIWEAPSLAVFLIVYLLLGTITYYVALPTDLVVPNLIIGAAAGRMVGLGLNAISPGSVDPGAYALIGMAALWSGTSGLVLTVVAVALEMTGDFSYLPALIIVSCSFYIPVKRVEQHVLMSFELNQVTFTSAWVSSTIGPSLYHTEMENNGAPYLPTEPANLLRTITTKQIMCKSVIAFQTTETMATIERVLQTTAFHGFPVVETVVVQDEEGGESARFVGDGVVSGVVVGERVGRAAPGTERYRPVGYVTRRRLIELIEEMQSTQVNPLTTVHIRSICKNNPMTVREDCTASKVYTWFRQLGLKRVYVVDEDGFMTGLVMRRDLIRPVVVAEEEEENRRPKTLIDLADGNRILEETFRERFNRTEEPEKLYLTLHDFDGVSYSLSTTDNKAVLNFSMSMKCFPELVAFGASAVLQREYGSLLQPQPEPGFDVTLRIDETQLGGVDKVALVRSLAMLKRNALAAPFEAAFQAQTEGRNTGVMTVNYREQESMYIMGFADRVTVIFSTQFKEEADKIFGKVFLQEFVDARRQPAIQNAPQVLYSHREPPLELSGLRLSDADNVGYVTFVLFPRHFVAGPIRENTISQIQLFRDYLHYHIKASKAYMHSRMRARVESFLKVLNRAKPEVKDDQKDKKTMG
ncbi:hypothetical protein HDU98_010512, partial [Podochytrium sp. JEL0797]